MKSIIEYSELKKEEILKVAKPILFNTEMMCANLDGRKSATRRVLKLPRHIKVQDNGLYTLFTEGTCYENQHIEEIIKYIEPKYKVGEYLYARETWCQIKDIAYWWEYIRSNNRIAQITADEYVYRADNIKNRPDGILPMIKWHPSIHMPKEAARFFIQVTDVRAERLRDIGDCKKEGIVPGTHSTAHMNDYDERCVFAALWNSTIPKEKQKEFGWEANPWVFVYEYKRIIPNDI